ncbi:site-specific DNA-methyltransferase [Desulfatiferula olefinivorans]
MKSTHRIVFEHAAGMKNIAAGSVHLVVTSPPYPMIEMWDSLFADQNPAIGQALADTNRMEAFELMHRELDAVWNQVIRVLSPGGFACINIGDATRTVDGHFMLYPNHARILSFMMKKGMTPLPEIVWRKQSNAPNKFMGSGMLPAGAYVTQEHEYILILRKGGKREFSGDEDREHRRRSAFFWEERNTFFSDVWFDLLGTRQSMDDKEVRKRSAAFPFELPYRLITMYSLAGDTVLDPFAGIGTTMLAAMCAGRNSVGYELFEGFRDTIVARTGGLTALSKERIDTRLAAHERFIEERLAAGKPIKHTNVHYHFPVITAQETGLLINEPRSLTQTGDAAFEVTYDQAPQADVVARWQGFTPETGMPVPGTSKPSKPRKKKNAPKETPVQMTLFS